MFRGYPLRTLTCDGWILSHFPRTRMFPESSAPRVICLHPIVSERNLIKLARTYRHTWILLDTPCHPRLALLLLGLALLFLQRLRGPITIITSSCPPYLTWPHSTISPTWSWRTLSMILVILTGLVLLPATCQRPFAS